MRTMNGILAAVVAGSTAGLAAAERPLTEGLGEAVLPMIRNLESNGVGSMMILGDSVSLIPNSYNWFMRDLFWAEYGNAGDGYLGLHAFRGECQERNGVTCGLEVRLGGRSRLSDDVGDVDELGRTSPDGGYLALEDGPTVGGSAEIRYFGTGATLHYVMRPGGGRFRIEQDFITLDEIDTNLPEGSTPVHARVTVPITQTDPEELNIFKVRQVGDGEVIINGLEMRSGQPGFRYHRVARGGAGPLRFVPTLTTANIQFASTLSPDLAIIMIDWSNEQDRQQYVINMNLILATYEFAMPNTRFVLMTHHPFRPAIAEQADLLLQLARDRGHGYINLNDLFSDFDEMDTLGFMQDIVHLTNTGGQFFGNYVYETIRDAGLNAMVADVTEDNAIDFFDVQAYLASFAAMDPSADLTNDGVIDFFDVARYLDAFAEATR